METDIYEFAKTIASQKDFIIFLKLLRKDLDEHNEEWENLTLDRFLSAMHAYCEDAKEAQPSWRGVANLFLGAKVYE